MRNLGQTSLVFIVLTAQATAANAHVLHHFADPVSTHLECSCPAVQSPAPATADHRHSHESPAGHHDCQDCFTCDATADLLTVLPQRPPSIAISVTPSLGDALPASPRTGRLAQVGPFIGAPPAQLHAVTLPKLD
jgi:hypothetical protein